MDTAQGNPETTLTLDEDAIERARSGLQDGAVTERSQPWRKPIIELLDAALATELVCVLRYKRHHFMANGMSSPAIAAEFMEHAQEESTHADRIAQRIVQLGGEPDFGPSRLLERSHAGYDDVNDLQAMVRSNLVAERVAIETYRQMVQLIGDKDPTTRQLLVEILAQEEEHADELSALLIG